MNTFESLVGSHDVRFHPAVSADEHLISELEGLVPGITPSDASAGLVCHAASEGGRTAYGLGCQTFVGKGCMTPDN